MIVKVIVSSGPDMVREVEIPEGHYRVWSGALKPGDRYLNCKLAQHYGQFEWVPIEKAAPFPYDSVECYGCIIRSGAPVERECERCGVRVRRSGCRYCWVCEDVVLKEVR